MVADETKSEASKIVGIQEGQQRSAFLQIFIQYDTSMTASREFLSQLGPYASSLDDGVITDFEERFKERAVALLGDFKEHAPKADKEEFERVLEEMSNTMRQRSPGVPAIEITSLRVGQVLVDLFGGLMHAPRPGTYRRLLNRSILMCLVSSFEVLVADLARLYYRLKPEATSDDDKVLSVNELKTFDSIDSALDFVVSRKIDELLRGSLEDWHKFFKTRMKIDLDGLVPDPAKWREFFQRRHIVVHADSRVTQRYLANVQWDKLAPGQSRPSVGQEISIDDDYLEDAMCAFEIAGLLLCQEVWKKLAPEETEMRLGNVVGLCGAVYRRLLTRNWYVAEHLAKWGELDGDAPEDAVLICKFNRWLCIKRQGRWEEVSMDVERFDCSAKHSKFALVRASLLEQPDVFFRVVPAARAAGVDDDNLKEWPILEEMRTDPRFAETISDSGGHSLTI